jgi:hypothetical protein
VPRPALNIWNDGAAPALHPTLNVDREAILDYVAVGQPTTLANYPLPAGAIVETDPVPAGQLIASVIGDQLIEQMLLIDSVIGDTWRPRAGGGPPASFITETAITTRPLLKVYVVNGDVAQTTFQLEVSRA